MENGNFKAFTNWYFLFASLNQVGPTFATFGFPPTECFIKSA